MNTALAFYEICQTAKNIGHYFVCLTETIPFYGGPEEGGWWGNDVILVAYQEYSSLQAAEIALDAIELLVEKLNQDEVRQHGDYCLRQIEFLEARGLDPSDNDVLDGPSHFSVNIYDSLPENNYANRHYE